MQCPRSLKGKNYFFESRTFTRSPEIIGQGAFGVVYKGTYGNSPCALKYIRSYLFQTVSANDYSMRQFERECEFAKELTSPYLVRFVGVSFDDHVPVLITELMECSLTEVLACQYCSVLYHREIDIALDIARGLQYLHSHKPPVVHRDLSSNNVLLASDHSVKLADLGVAKCVNTASCSPMPGTTVYMPPEVAVPSPLSTAIDLFSYAVLLIQLETRHFPNPAEKVEAVMQDGETVEVEGGGEGLDKEEESTDFRKDGVEEGEPHDSRYTESESGNDEEHSLIHSRTRTEIERRSDHIELMDDAGLFHRVVMCYLQESPALRKKIKLREVIGWLENETQSLKYTDSVQSNPEMPLEHKTNNHPSVRGRPLSSLSSHQSTPRHAKWWQKVTGKKKSASTGAAKDSGYNSQQLQQHGRHTTSSQSPQVADSMEGWQMVREEVPADTRSSGAVGRAVYSLSRLSNTLGLTAADEDDSEYILRVMKSL